MFIQEITKQVRDDVIECFILVNLFRHLNISLWSEAEANSG